MDSNHQAFQHEVTVRYLAPIGGPTHDGAPGGIRTRTIRPLRPMPLPSWATGARLVGGAGVEPAKSPRSERGAFANLTTRRRLLTIGAGWFGGGRKNRTPSLLRCSPGFRIRLPAYPAAPSASDDARGMTRYSDRCATVSQRLHCSHRTGDVKRKIGLERARRIELPFSRWKRAALAIELRPHGSLPWSRTTHASFRRATGAIRPAGREGADRGASGAAPLGFPSGLRLTALVTDRLRGGANRPALCH